MCGASQAFRSHTLALRVAVQCRWGLQFFQVIPRSRFALKFFASNTGQISACMHSEVSSQQDFAAGRLKNVRWAIIDLDYCNRRNVRTRKNFVLWRSRTFVRYKFLYCKGGVTYTVIRVWFSYATKFRTFSQKYKKYEIKVRDCSTSARCMCAVEPHTLLTLWTYTTLETEC